MAEKRPDRALGPGHDTFWEGCAQGALRLPRNRKTGDLVWPIEQAVADDADAFVWETLSGRGTIVSWCSFERDYYQGQFPIPWDCILVELEEGPLFLSNPKDMGWRDLSVGMPVRVAFLDCEDSAGPFSLPVFEADTITTEPVHPRS